MSRPNAIVKHQHNTSGGLERIGPLLADLHPDYGFRRRFVAWRRKQIGTAFSLVPERRRVTDMTALLLTIEIVPDMMEVA